MPKLHAALIIRGNKVQLFTQNCQFALIRALIRRITVYKGKVNCR